MAPTLIVLPSVRAVPDGKRFFLDRKAVEGLSLYAELWPGPVLCLMRSGDRAAIGYGDVFAADELPFRLAIIAEDPTVQPGVFADAALVLAAGDNHRDFPLAGAVAAPLVYIIEYTLATRLRIVRLTERRPIKAMKSMLWTLATERKRRRAFARAAGLQCNGRPAYDAYRSATPNPLLFFDTRTTDARQIGDEALTAKRADASKGDPLRLAYSGRLEPMKGADHLVPVAVALARRGIAFTFDIYGDGSQRGAIEAAIGAAGLADRVTLHGSVGFEEELIPAMIGRTDLFICCHRQADPSCTYLETLSCGVPIVGYDNAAFRGVLGLGDAGVAVPIDRADALAAAVAVFDQDRASLAAMMARAARIGAAHSFEKVFAERIAHLRAIAGV